MNRAGQALEETGVVIHTEAWQKDRCGDICPAPTRCQGPTHRLRVHFPPGGSRAFLASVLSLTRIFWDHAVCHARGPWGRGQSRQSVTQGFYKQRLQPPISPYPKQL